MDYPRPFTSALAFQIWDTRYRWRELGEVRDVEVADTWRRVARALAACEPRDSGKWERRFAEVLQDFRFLPGGRILAGAGTGPCVTLFNCFVMGRLPDSMTGIFNELKEAAITMQHGGGIGADFSPLRPRGEAADQTGGVASGPVSFMRVWDSMCATVVATSARRGAMMATLACDHPDIEDFIDAKADPRELRRFNLSVLVTDPFMAAVRADRDWPLSFPCGIEGTSSGNAEPRRVYRHVRARALWNKLMRANYAYAEPGVLFIDRINAQNNLAYAEVLRATNPCGEVPLPPHGACDLGSVNLTRLVEAPFTAQAKLDWPALRDTVATATRMLDDVYAISMFPLPEQREAALRCRRLGIGVTGLADAMVMLGLHYGEPASLDFARNVMREVAHAAYRSSVELARERGPFPAFDRAAYLHAPFIARLPEDIRAAIEAYGIRNSHLLAIAPAGSISVLANTISSGLEPIFAAEYRRAVREGGGERHTEPVVDYAVQLYRHTRGPQALPPAFVALRDVAPEKQLEMQAALQEHVDNAISKTVSVPEQFDFDRFARLFDAAYALGLKGCTTFRPNVVTGTVLTTDDDLDRCCAMSAS